MKRLHLFLFVLLLCVGVKGEERGALILRSPQDYQVYAISPNGEWATGVYVNYSNMGYGFRWNLVTDKVELLSGDLCLSEGTAISNDGVVVGMFDNTIFADFRHTGESDESINGAGSRTPDAKLDSWWLSFAQY